MKAAGASRPGRFHLLRRPSNAIPVTGPRVPDTASLRLTVVHLRVLDALVLRRAAHRVALLDGDFVLRVTGVVARFPAHVGPLVGGVGGGLLIDLRNLRAGLRLRMRGLRLFYANVFLIARQVVAFLLCDVVVRVSLRDARVVARLVGVLVVRFELGLRDFFLAFGLRLANVLRVARQRAIPGVSWIGISNDFSLACLTASATLRGPSVDVVVEKANVAPSAGWPARLAKPPFPPALSASA